MQNGGILSLGPRAIHSYTDIATHTHTHTHTPKLNVTMFMGEALKSIHTHTHTHTPQN